MNRSQTCTCTDAQLYHVGCDCSATLDAVIVDVWKDGYASDNKARITIEGGLDVATEVRRQFGSFATIYHSRPLFAPIKPQQKYSAEYIREMSKGG